MGQGRWQLAFGQSHEPGRAATQALQLAQQLVKRRGQRVDLHVCGQRRQRGAVQQRGQQLFAGRWWQLQLQLRAGPLDAGQRVAFKQGPARLDDGAQAGQPLRAAGVQRHRHRALGDAGAGLRFVA